MRECLPIRAGSEGSFEKSPKCKRCGAPTIPKSTPGSTSGKPQPRIVKARCGAGRRPERTRRPEICQALRSRRKVASHLQAVVGPVPAAGCGIRQALNPRHRRLRPSHMAPAPGDARTVRGRASGRLLARAPCSHRSGGAVLRATDGCDEAAGPVGKAYEPMGV